MDLLALCDRFHKLPDEILAADSMIFQLIAIERRWKHGQ